MPDASGWGRFATGRLAVPRSRVCRARCSASYPAIPRASVRFGFLRRTNNKALEADHLCCVPGGVGKTDGGARYKQPRRVVGPPQPRARSGKHRPAYPRSNRYSPLQVTRATATIEDNHFVTQ
jgi:hypothetical protein